MQTQLATNGIAHAEQLEPLQMVQVTTMETLMECWPFVKAGIERIKHRDKSAGSAGNWTPAHIFNAIKFGLPTPQRTTAVELYVAINTTTKKLRGFMVTTPKLDPFAGNVPMGIIIWLLYADTKFSMLEQFLPAIENLCRQTGGDIIEFQSGRLGWLRNFGRMKKLGFEICQYKFFKRI